MTIPRLTTEQLEAARAAATDARRRRAGFKDDLRAGRIGLASALDLAAGDEVLSHLKVVDVLKSLPRVGEKRAAQVMDRLEIASNRRVRGLGRLQVAGLKAEFS